MIDWGIGGISVYKLIREKLGAIPTVYFSDTGVTPYGKMARKELAARLDKVIEYLASRGATHIVIACNAASTAIPDLKTQLPVKGVIESAIDLTVKKKPEKLGVIGGRRTVVSGIYRKAFEKSGIAVSQRVAQPISALIESGDVSSPELKAACRQILGPIRNSSHILLACTHYPAITPILCEIVSPDTQFIDPAEQLVSDVKRWKVTPGDESVFLTTGDAAKMKKAARNAFGVEIDTVTKIRL